MVNTDKFKSPIKPSLTSDISIPNFKTKIMKKTLFVFKAVMLISMSTMIIQSCNKDNEIKEDLMSHKDMALAEATFDELQDIADEAASGNLESFKQGDDSQKALLSSCATFTHDTLSSPKTLTVDFGTENCLGNDGRYRRGRVIVSYTGAYREPGHVHIFTTENYFVNDNQLLGTTEVENTGHNSDGNLVFTIEIDGQIIKEDGGVITRVSSRVREWIEGEETGTRFDDVYLITGTHSGQASNGRGFEAETITPLRKEIGCRWIVSGSMQVDPNHREEGVLDFGNGNCDRLATVTLNGIVRTIQLRN